MKVVILIGMTVALMLLTPHYVQIVCAKKAEKVCVYVINYKLL
jgi:hypothetical protein